MNIHERWRSWTSTTCSVRQDLSGRMPAEHQRAPGDPQRDAERGRVRAVPADVADDHAQTEPSAACDGVVEVAAEQRPAPAGR